MISYNTKYKFHLLIFNVVVFTWITLSILCLKFSTEVRSSSWDEVIASEHQYLDEQRNRPLPPTKTTQKSPRDSNQAMREPHFLTPKSWKVTLAPVLSFSGGVGWCTILLKGEGLIFEVFLYFFKNWNQNIVDVAI